MFNPFSDRGNLKGGMPYGPRKKQAGLMAYDSIDGEGQPRRVYPGVRHRSTATPKDDGYDDTRQVWANAKRHQRRIRNLINVSRGGYEGIRRDGEKMVVSL